MSTKAEIEADIQGLAAKLAELQPKLAAMPRPEPKPEPPDVEDYDGDIEGLSAARHTHQTAYDDWQRRNKAIEDSRASLQKQIAAVQTLLAQKRTLHDGADELATLHQLGIEFAKHMAGAEATWKQMELCAARLKAIHYPSDGKNYLDRFEWKAESVKVAVQLRPSGITVHGPYRRDNALQSPGIVAIEREQKAA